MRLPHASIVRLRTALPVSFWLPSSAWPRTRSSLSRRSPPSLAVCVCEMSGWLEMNHDSANHVLYWVGLKSLHCTVLNFPLLPHGLPLSASKQFSEKLAENLSTTYKPYSLTQYIILKCAAADLKRVKAPQRRRGEGRMARQWIFHDGTNFMPLKYFTSLWIPPLLNPFSFFPVAHFSAFCRCNWC